MPRTIVVGPYLRDRAELLAAALSERRGVAGRGAGRRARRQAPPARAGRAQRPPRPRPGPAAARAPPPAPGRVARRPARGAGDGGAAGADRGLRHLQPRRRAHRRLDGRLRGRRDEEVRLPPLQGPRRAATGRDAAPTTSPRWRRCSARRDEPLPRAGRPLAARRQARRELRLAALAGRDRRRQGAARGRDAGAAAVRRARRHRRQPRQARWRRSTSRAARRRSTSPPTRRPRSCCSGSATRRTASRSTTTAAAATGR